MNKLPRGLLSETGGGWGGGRVQIVREFGLKTPRVLAAGRKWRCEGGKKRLLTNSEATPPVLISEGLRAESCSAGWEATGSAGWEATGAESASAALGHYSWLRKTPREADDGRLAPSLSPLEREKITAF